MKSTNENWIIGNKNDLETEDVYLAEWPWVSPVPWFSQLWNKIGFNYLWGIFQLSNFCISVIHQWLPVLWFQCLPFQCMPNSVKEKYLVSRNGNHLLEKEGDKIAGLCICFLYRQSSPVLLREREEVWYIFFSKRKTRKSQVLWERGWLSHLSGGSSAPAQWTAPRFL